MPAQCPECTRKETAAPAGVPGWRHGLAPLRRFWPAAAAAVGVLALLAGFLVGGSDGEQLARDEHTPAPSASEPLAPPEPPVEPERPKHTPDAIFAKVSPAVVRIVLHDAQSRPAGLGSGFIVSEDGLVVTNYHVIDGGMESATVELANGTGCEVVGVVAADPEADLALLQADFWWASDPVGNSGRDPNILVLATGALPAVGSKVYAIGSPQGLTNTLSEGLVSAHRTDSGDLTLIQTTAAVSPGSSGGPLLSEAGQVIGVVTWSWREGQNLNFAVPAARVARLIQEKGPTRRLSEFGTEPKRDSLAEVQALLDLADYGRALQLLAAMRGSQADNPEFWSAMGTAQERLGNLELAADAFRKEIELGPDRASAYYNLGSTYNRMERPKDAMSAFEAAARLDSTNVAHLVSYASALSGVGRSEECFKVLRSALALAPNNARVYAAFGSAYEQVGRYSESVAAYRTAIELAIADNTVDPSFDFIPLTLFHNLGLVYFRMRRFDDAISTFEAGLELPLDPVFAPLREHTQQALGMARTAKALLPQNGNRSR